jgi:hypothetical protein
LRQEREGCGEKGRGRLADEKQPPAVEAAALPVQGARTSIGANCAKLRTPRRRAECVSRKMRMAPARFWNHVPLAESALPTK